MILLPLHPWFTPESATKTKDHAEIIADSIVEFTQEGRFDQSIIALDGDSTVSWACSQSYYKEKYCISYLEYLKPFSWSFLWLPAAFFCQGGRRYSSIFFRIVTLTFCIRGSVLIISSDPPFFKFMVNVFCCQIILKPWVLYINKFMVSLVEVSETLIMFPRIHLYFYYN